VQQQLAISMIKVLQPPASDLLNRMPRREFGIVLLSGMMAAKKQIHSSFW
jgi:hypothetical protein